MIKKLMQCRDCGTVSVEADFYPIMVKDDTKPQCPDCSSNEIIEVIEIK